jgi:hypothetical protein
MAFIPTEEEILSKSDINWIINGEAGDESITNRPTNDVANFVNTVKEYAIFTDPSKKNLTEQTISSPLKLNSYLGLHGGETGGIRFFNVGDENDSASISLTKDLEGNQFLKISSLNDAGDKIQFEVTDKDSIKVLLKNGTTVETSKIFHSGNHGKNSGLDADKIHGVSPASSNNVNAVVQRNSSGNFSANEITANKFLGNSTNVTGIVAAVNGGTGFSSFTYGDILIATDSDELEKISLGNAKEILISTGTGTKPVWRRLKADDFSDSEVISTKNGGTGTVGLNGILFGNGENAVTVATGLQITSKIDEEYVKNAKYADSCGGLSATTSYTAASFNNITGLSNSNPLRNGVVSIGTSTTAARADHVHPDDTIKANISGSTFTGVISIIDGTQLTPGLSFKDDTDTGLFRNSSGNFSISCNNTEVINFASDKITAKKDIYALEINASKGNFSGTVSAPDATISGNLKVSTSNVAGGGIILSDDGDIVDLNDGYCSMRFSNGVRITNGKQLSESKIHLRNDGKILATNDIIAFYSDERLKEKTGIIENPLEKVKSLSAFYYKENELAKSFGFKNTKTQIGLSAQAVQKVLPEAVNLAPFDMEMDENGDCNSKSGNDYLTLDYAKIVPLLIEAIKEQQKQIEELQSRQNNVSKN